MKTFAIAALVGIALIGMVAGAVALDNKYPELTQETEVIGITVTGKAGVHINETLCVNPLNGQVEYCF